MNIVTRYLAEKANRVALGLWMITIATGLSGCGLSSQSNKTPIERLDFSSPSSLTGEVKQGLTVADYDPQATENPAKIGLSEGEAKQLGCKIRDRFDRGATFAYNFDNQQTRLSFHLGLNGPSLGAPTQMEFKSVFVRYTHKFSKPPEGKREKCRFQSNVQGLIGSAYNELFVRNNYTVWQEIRNKLK
jgi:hypothetical protein